MHYYLLAFQKNSRIKSGNVHLNKNIVDFCMTENTFMLLIGGVFYLQTDSDLIMDTSKGLDRADLIKYGRIEQGGAMIMSRASLKSLVQSHIDH